VSEAYGNSIKAGDNAVVTSGPKWEGPATVRVVSRSINATSRTFTVELRLQDKTADLRPPNMVATVRIRELRRPCHRFRWTQQRDEQKRSYAYVVAKPPARRSEGKQTGNTYNGKVEVTRSQPPPSG
jgi:multidrug efflux pump subunit AcrA (membrane-fusion protein)